MSLLVISHHLLASCRLLIVRHGQEVTFTIGVPGGSRLDFLAFGLWSSGWFRQSNYHVVTHSVSTRTKHKLTDLKSECMYLGTYLGEVISKEGIHDNIGRLSE
jgi:hypothetical protein